MKNKASNRQKQVTQQDSVFDIKFSDETHVDVVEFKNAVSQELNRLTHSELIEKYC